MFLRNPARNNSNFAQQQQQHASTLVKKRQRLRSSSSSADPVMDKVRKWSLQQLRRLALAQDNDGLGDDERDRECCYRPVVAQVMDDIIWWAKVFVRANVYHPTSYFSSRQDDSPLLKCFRSLDSRKKSLNCLCSPEKSGNQRNSSNYLPAPGKKC